MKALEELKVDDIIFIYSIVSLPNKEALTKVKAKIYRVRPQFNTASAHEEIKKNIFGEVRRIIKMNEGIVYRNAVWLTEENDEAAKDILINHFNRKLEILENEITVNQSRLILINDFFSKEN